MIREAAAGHARARDVAVRRAVAVAGRWARVRTSAVERARPVAAFDAEVAGMITDAVHRARRRAATHDVGLARLIGRARDHARNTGRAHDRRERVAVDVAFVVRAAAVALGRAHERHVAGRAIRHECIAVGVVAARCIAARRCILLTLLVPPAAACDQRARSDRDEQSPRQHYSQIITRYSFLK